MLFNEMRYVLFVDVREFLYLRNIEAALAAVRPDGIDVNSGVEDAPGKKNRFKLEEFLRAVRSGDV